MFLFVGYNKVDVGACHTALLCESRNVSNVKLERSEACTLIAFISYLLTE